MADTAIAGLGVKFSYTPYGGSIVNLDSELLDITPPNGSITKVPSSTHADTHARHIVGRIDDGEAQVTILFGPKAIALYAIRNAKTRVTWVLTFSDNHTFTATGYVLGGQDSSDPNGVAQTRFTFSIDGAGAYAS